MKYPIYIPTKGRFGKLAKFAKTIPLLQGEKIPFTCFVEPKELKKYKKSFPKVDFVELKDNDRGIAFARQSILDYARMKKVKRYWQLDDDVVAFYKLEKPGKVGESNAKKVLGGVEKFVHGHKNKDRIALATPQVPQLMWCAKKEYAYFAIMGQCILTSTFSGRNYNTDLLLLSDIDFVLQHIHYRWLMVALNVLGFRTSKMGHTKGGLYKTYREGKRVEAVKFIFSKWKKYCKPPKPDATGFINVLIDGKKARQHVFGKKG